MATPLRLDYAVNDAEVIAAFKRQQAEMEKERKARQELEKQINSNAAAQKTADKAGTDAAKSAASEQAKLAASAAKIAESVRTPMQSYKAGLTELRDHLKSGRLEQDQYRAAVDKLKASYDDATGKTKAAKDAEMAHTVAVREASAIAAKYATAEDRVSTAIKRLNELKAMGVLKSKDHARAVAAENAKLAETTDEASEATGRLDGRFSALAATGVGTVAFIHQMAATLKELRTEMADDVQQFDKLSRKLGIQGGLSDEERKVQSKIVGEVALDAAVPIEKAFETATQLSSSGFVDPVKSGTLDTALALMQSSNQIDGDAASFIKGSGQFMTAFGMKKDEGNFKDLGVRMQGLFKSTDVQAADLPEFAKAAPVLSGAGLDLEQSLSALTSLRETMNAGEAATGARNVVSMLQTAGVNKTATDALASVGLKPQQVDIEGEGLQKALETLKEATSKLGEADRAGVMSQVFGRENMAAASILMDSTEKFDKYAAMQRGANESFKADVKTARSGAFAEDVRSDVTEQMDSMKHEDFSTQQERSRSARVNIRRRAAMREAEKGGVSGTFNAAMFGIGGAVDDNLIRPIIGESTTNLGPAHAAEMARLSGQQLQLPPELKSEMDREKPVRRLEPVAQIPPELTAAIDRQTAVLERIEALDKQGVQQNSQKAHAGIVAGRVNQREGAN